MTAVNAESILNLLAYDDSKMPGQVIVMNYLTIDHDEAKQWRTHLGVPKENTLTFFCPALDLETGELVEDGSTVDLMKTTGLGVCLIVHEDGKAFAIVHGTDCPMSTYMDKFVRSGMNYAPESDLCCNREQNGELIAMPAAEFRELVAEGEALVQAQESTDTPATNAPDVGEIGMIEP